MGHDNKQLKTKAIAVAAAVFLCLSASAVFGAESVKDRASILNNPLLAGDQSILLAQNQIHPGTPMVLNPITGAFDFDLGGSETRKLQLQLSHPLVLETNSYLQSSFAGSNLLGLDGTFRMPLNNGFSLQGGAAQILSNNQIQNLGNIQCLNGTLGPNSYTASDCRFVNQSSSKFDRRKLHVGASQELGNLSTAVSWFTAETESGATGVDKFNQLNPSALLIDNRMLAPFANDNLMADSLSTDYISSQTTGIDLNFQLGFATSQAGEIQLGLALTRVLDANFQGIYSSQPGPLDWNLAEPFNTAAMGIQWSSGSFSSGVRGYYREPVNFLNRNTLDSMSTFDVHFTWRAPWNANLSVGASNVLGSGVNDRNSIDENADRFESIYGRIPYVRYQQDL